MKRMILLLCGVFLAAFFVVDGVFDAENIFSVFHEETKRQTLIIDAGHGGFDGGAQALDGTTEQYINLCIARDLGALCALFGERVVLTRPDEEALDYASGRSIHENKVADLKARKEIAESVQNGIFLSIHLNKFQETQYFGAQTFYSNNHVDSKLYAESIQAELIKGLGNNNTRKAKIAPKTVYLMNQLKCPALIVECGFLSNPEELLSLKDEDYHKRIALCILSGYLSAQ